MKKETPYTHSQERSGKCTRTTKMSFSSFRSILMKALKRSSGSRMKNASVSSTDLPDGLQKDKKSAIRKAKKNMADLGGRWGVVKLGERYCEVERTYFKVHGIKPVWYRKTFREWLTGTKL